MNIKMLLRGKFSQLWSKLTTCFYPYRRLFFRVLFLLVIVFITVAITLYANSPPPSEQEKEKDLIERLNIVLENDQWSPGFDNITGWPIDIVPNIVHYVLFKEHKVTYIHMLSLFSVIKIHKPESIIIHCDCDKIDGDETYDRVLRLLNETNEVTLYINRIEAPREIFGRQIKDHNLAHHGSDFSRYQLLKKYGGFCFDNDVFVCQPLHQFRKFEFTLNWDEGQYLGIQILMGNRHARFLKFVEETYKEYDNDKWYYNAGDLPTKAILWKYPHLVHRIKVKFGTDAPAVCPFFYSEYHADWQTRFYTFHMVARGNAISWKDWCLGGNRNHPMREAFINDDLIKNLNTTFGEMGRLILFGSKTLPEEPVKPEESEPKPEENKPKPEENGAQK